MTDRRFKKKLLKIQKQGERYKKEKLLRDAYAKYYPKDHKKRKVSNIMLAVTICAVVWYVVLDVILQYQMGIEISPTITPFWFTFWTTEVWVLSRIKINKVKNNYNNESYAADDSSDDFNDGACG